LFLVLGALLAIYGLVSDAAIYQRSLGINVNLLWGAVMIGFGAAMMIWRSLSPAIVHDAVGDPPREPSGR
jgi:hypothetical protein